MILSENPLHTPDQVRGRLFRDHAPAGRGSIAPGAKPPASGREQAVYYAAPARWRRAARLATLRASRRAMWLFLKRYFGWYLWLGIYASAIGSLVGMAFFAFPFLPFLIFFFFYIFPLGFALAAPLNLALLPVVFHLTRDDPRRRRTLRLAAAIGGTVSPLIGWSVAGTLFLPNAATPRDLFPFPFVFFGFIGALAGMVCARLWHKHGDKASIFDVNGQLDATRAALALDRRRGAPEYRRG
jgi:hypothetical protein